MSIETNELSTETVAAAPQEAARHPISVSQLQLWYRCGYAWHLRYERGHSPRVGAGAWFGRVMHEIIALMYRGLRMDAAHRQVWTRECGPVWDDLQRLIVVDAAYAAEGRPTTITAKKWRDAHPEYDAVLARIADFQQHALSSYRWGKTQSLADYYRRAVVLLESEGDLLLTRPLLIEGIPAAELTDPEEREERLEAGAAPIVEVDEDGRGTRYRSLHGSIAGVAVQGVPDVLARDADGCLCVADYKTGKPLSHEEVAASVQMAIYVELLRQNGAIGADDTVRIGHIYLTETGVLPIWSDTRQQADVIRRLERQLSIAAALMENGLFSDRKGLDAFQSPCSFCDLAHVCDA
jgi:PD-(D/E)XK nuclease superfamily